MPRVALAFVAGLALLTIVGADSPDTEWVLLPSASAEELTSQCSRWSPSNFEDTWEPAASDIRALEERLHKVERLRAKQCCVLRGRVRDVHDYYRQYVGIVLNGKKLIYVNAFHRDSRVEDWSTPVIFCDGGEAHWGVLFDPERGKFSDLAFNGFA